MAGQEEWDWKRIGEQVRLRRGQLGYKRQEDLASMADLGLTLIRHIEGGKPERYRSSSLALLARALDWPRDAFERLGQGEDLDGDGTAHEIAALRRELSSLRRLVERLADDVQHLVTPNTSQGGATGERER